MTHAHKTFCVVRAVEAFASGLCLTLIAASVLMAVEAQAAPHAAPIAEGAAPVASPPR